MTAAATVAIPQPRTSDDDQSACIAAGELIAWSTPKLHACHGELTEYTCCGDTYCAAIEDDHTANCRENLR